MRRYKGRYVFDGSNVFDQSFNHAIFQELGSVPSSLEASKIADWYGLWPGHTCEQADAEQAYTQAVLDTTTTTWVIIPREYWPEGWAEKYGDYPVVNLIKAFYGHPDSGGIGSNTASAISLRRALSELQRENGTLASSIPD